MKKFLSSLVLLLLVCGCILRADAASFNEAINQQRPCAVLIYADWADDISAVLNAFGQLEQAYSPKYNFVKLNIANSEAKEFNTKYYIYPNLPYILLFRDKGKISRCITRDCIKDNSCVKEKFDFFVN